MSITPKQAFEAVRVQYPTATHISLPMECCSLNLHRAGRSVVGCYIDAQIDCGDQTQYPPPAPKWRPATVEDVVKYLRGQDVKARFWNGKDEKLHGYLAGHIRTGVRREWIACSGNHWDNCEVAE